MKRFECISKPLMWSMALLLALFAAGCNQGSGPILGGIGGSAPVADTTAPRIIITGAIDGASGVPTNGSSTATFSEIMKSSTLVSASPSTAAGTAFTVCAVAAPNGVCVTPVAGVVSYSGTTATFKPDSLLTASTWYKSTVSIAAKDVAGNALVSGLVPNPWSWQTGTGKDMTPPTVTVTNPANVATNVPVGNSINATFSEAMSQATMISANFTVQETVTTNNVPGTVSYDALANIATFKPLSALLANTDYTATVTGGATDLAGNALVVPASSPKNPWTFRTALAGPAAPLAINLRSAASFGIASRAGLTTTGVTVINGDVALYPLASCTDATGNAGASQTCLVKTYTSVTGMSVNGSIYWAGDPFDNGATANTVTNDLNIAWTEGQNKVDTFATGFLVGEIGVTPEALYREISNRRKAI